METPDRLVLLSSLKELPHSSLSVPLAISWVFLLSFFFSFARPHESPTDAIYAIINVCWPAATNSSPDEEIFTRGATKTADGMPLRPSSASSPLPRLLSERRSTRTRSSLGFPHYKSFLTAALTQCPQCWTRDNPRLMAAAQAPTRRRPSPCILPSRQKRRVQRERVQVQRRSR